MQTQYHIRLEKEQHVFSAAHFITYNENVCERLHGHNYRVAISIFAPLDSNHYVVDFIAARDILAAILLELDHHLLLPDCHPLIRVQADEREVLITFAERRWIIPRGDCVILPIANTTAELLANYIGQRFLSDLQQQKGFIPLKLLVEVDENQGQWGVCEFLPARTA
jgi:6-pyruvoyltetrahydropterin/6-carboxytetrahydropterin synthase